MSADLTTVLTGSTVVLSWNSTNALMCTASDSWTGVKPTSGSELSATLNANAVFTLSCNGPGGSARESVAVDVVTTSVAPAVSISATPTIVPPGGSAEIIWSAQGVTNCTATGDWAGTVERFGSRTVVPPRATSSYGLNCVGPSGSASNSVVIEFAAQGPVSVRLAADMTTIPKGADVLLSWSAIGASSCIATGGQWTGAKPIVGFQIIGNLQNDSAFELTCSGPGGSGSDVAKVHAAGEPTIALRAEPPAVYTGEQARLIWSTADANSCVASGAWTGPRPLSGTELTPALNEAERFALTCDGVGGQSEAAVTVPVSPPPDPTVTLNVDAPTVPSGAIALLTWNGVRVSACEASGDWTGPRATSGTEPVGPLESDRSYTLTCASSGGNVEASLSVGVVPREPPPSASTVELLQVDFVEWAGRPGHEAFVSRTSEPTSTGAASTLFVVLSAQPQTAVFELIDTSGTVLAVAPLAPFADTPSVDDYIGEITLPTQRFLVRASGLDADGAPYAVTSRQFTPTTFDVRFEADRVYAKAGTSTIVPMSIRNLGSVAQDFVLAYSGMTNQADEFLQVGAGATVERTITVDVPSTALAYTVSEVVGEMRLSADSSVANSANIEVLVTP